MAYLSGKYFIVFISLSYSIFTSDILAFNKGKFTDDQFNQNYVALASKLNERDQKIRKCVKKKDINGCFTELYKFKSDLEVYTGYNIDLDHAIINLFARLKQYGGKLHPHEMMEIKKFIIYMINKHESKDKYRSICLLSGGIYNQSEKEMFFMSNYTEYKKKHRIEDIDIPVKLMVGLTEALCGVFILVIPLNIPGKNSIAIFLISDGLIDCKNEIVDSLEKRRAPPTDNDLDEFFFMWKIN